MPTGPTIPQNIIKIFQTFKKSLSAHKFGLEFFSVECTSKRIKQKLSLLHATPNTVDPRYLEFQGTH